MEEDVSVEHHDSPGFGDENTNKEDVYAFYKFWENFTTLKQFAYVDQYNPNEAPNRRIKRLIEAENLKERKKE